MRDELKRQFMRDRDRCKFLLTNPLFHYLKNAQQGPLGYYDFYEKAENDPEKEKQVQNLLRSMPKFSEAAEFLDTFIKYAAILNKTKVDSIDKVVHPAVDMISLIVPYQRIEKQIGPTNSINMPKGELEILILGMLTNVAKPLSKSGRGRLHVKTFDSAEGSDPSTYFDCYATFDDDIKPKDQKEYRRQFESHKTVTMRGYENYLKEMNAQFKDHDGYFGHRLVFKRAH